MTPEEQIQYEKALKRVKKIKGFYTHLLVYVVINLMIVILIRKFFHSILLGNWSSSSRIINFWW